MNYPHSLDDSNSLFQVKDLGRSALFSEIDATQLEVMIEDPTNFPEGRHIVVVESEVIIISHRIDNILYVEKRGAFDTLSENHITNSKIGVVFTSAHYETLRDSIIDIQKEIWTYRKPVNDVLDDPQAIIPVENESYVVGLSPLNEFIGKENNIATWNGIEWTFIAPQVGFETYVVNKGKYEFNGTSWVLNKDVEISNVNDLQNQLNNRYTKSENDNLLNTKQDNLVSGTNIKTINGQSVLGSGNIEITGGGTVNIAPEDMPVSKPAEDEFLSHSLLMGIQTLSNYEEMEILKRFIVSNLHSRVGELVMTTSNAPPSDCIFADGVLLKRSEYPLLWRFAENSGNIVSDSKWKATHKFAYSYGDGVSTFRIPDYRGEFIRGFDAGAGVDTNRTLGSLQMDDFKSHKHPELPLSWRAIFTAGTDRYGWYHDQNDYAKPPQYEAGGSETRPRNGTVVYCIKYK